LSGTLTVVAPPNTAPVLPTQVDRTLHNLTGLSVVNSATDSDLPAQTLTYALLNPPAGMQINSGGVITWTPTLAQSPSTNVVTTVVTDTGVPSLSATNSFLVVVTSPYDGIDLTNPARALADDDGDGLSNLMEYGLGTDPRNPLDGPNALITTLLSDSGSQYVTLQFKRRKQDLGINLQYLPEVSGDGQSWSSDSAHVLELSVTSLDDQFDWVVVRDRTATTSLTPRLARLRVVEN
jgi:hypothetical protein